MEEGPERFSPKTKIALSLESGGSNGVRAYNPCMFHSLNSLLGRAAVERMTLLVNHVLGSEPVAMRRLKPHAGRSIQLHFRGWPALLPPLPATTFRVTNAGLLEWCDAEAPIEPDLRVEIDASNPALAMFQTLTGERPKVVVAGDAEFATDLNWLIDNLRWDVQDDLARIVGDAPARQIGRVGGWLAGALREGAKALRDLTARAPGGDTSTTRR